MPLIKKKWRTRREHRTGSVDWKQLDDGIGDTLVIPLINQRHVEREASSIPSPCPENLFG
jgi:hypothetical protein